MACDIINYTSREGKRGEKVPIELEHGYTPDISRFRFEFYEDVLYDKDEPSFPNER